MKLKYHDFEIDAELEAGPYKSPEPCEHQRVRSVCIFCGQPRWLALATWAVVDLVLLIVAVAGTAWFFLNR